MSPPAQLRIGSRSANGCALMTIGRAIEDSDEPAWIAVGARRRVLVRHSRTAEISKTEEEGTRRVWVKQENTPK